MKLWQQASCLLADQHHSSTQVRWQLLLVLTALSLSLVSCSGHNMSDLENRITEVKARKKGHIKPLPEIEPIEAFLYSAGQERDPFTPSVAEQQQIAIMSEGTGLTPNWTRPKEELEYYDLDAIRMVGTLTVEADQVNWALVKSPDGTIYRVKPGNYMGRNHGQIIAVTANKIELTEIVPDIRTTGYRERPASISLSQ